MKTSKTLSDRTSEDHEFEPAHGYNEAIKHACEVDDQTFVDLLRRIIKREEGHVGWSEIQRTQFE